MCPVRELIVPVRINEAVPQIFSVKLMRSICVLSIQLKFYTRNCILSFLLSDNKGYVGDQ
jgi:hypothetical protein